MTVGRRVFDLQEERDELRAKVAHLAAKLARYESLVGQRDRELADDRTRKELEGQERAQLAVDVARLSTVVGERDRQLQRTKVGKTEQEVLTAARFAEYALKWRESEEQLNVEVAQQRVHIDALSAELAKYTYELDRMNRERDRFREVLDQAADAIVIVDEQTDLIVDANDTACRWLGCQREHLRRLRIDDVGFEFPNGLPDADKISDGLNAPQFLRTGIVRGRGNLQLPVEVAVARHRFDVREYLLVIARDVSSRNLGHVEAGDAGLSVSPKPLLADSAAILSTRNGMIVDMNDAAIELFGYSREEFLGVETKSLYVEPERVRRQERNLVTQGTPVNLDIVCRGKDGVEFPARLEAVPWHVGNGLVLRYLCRFFPVQTAEN